MLIKTKKEVSTKTCLCSDLTRKKLKRWEPRRIQWFSWLTAIDQCMSQTLTTAQTNSLISSRSWKPRWVLSRRRLSQMKTIRSASFFLAVETRRPRTPSTSRISTCSTALIFQTRHLSNCLSKKLARLRKTMDSLMKRRSSRVRYLPIPHKLTRARLLARRLETWRWAQQSKANLEDPVWIIRIQDRHCLRLCGPATRNSNKLRNSPSPNVFSCLRTLICRGHSKIWRWLSNERKTWSHSMSMSSYSPCRITHRCARHLTLKSFMHQW